MESKVKKVVIHRFSLGGGNLELQLEGDATVAGYGGTSWRSLCDGGISFQLQLELRAAAGGRCHRARDEKKYKVDFSMKKVRLFLSHFELVEDNIDLLIEKEIMTGRQQPGYAAERDYESRSRSQSQPITDHPRIETARRCSSPRHPGAGVANAAGRLALFAVARKTLPRARRLPLFAEALCA
eukprot:g11200.t1